MSDKFTQVTERGLGSNIARSVKGALLGVALFFGSFGVLWWNEGRQDMSLVAAQTQPVSAAAVDASANGKPVSITGNLVTSELLGDAPYLNAGQYIALVRQVEMFAWVEKKEKKEQDKVGGGTEVTTTYTYIKEWTSRPAASNQFAHPEGHINPGKTLENREWHVASAKIGAYTVDSTSIGLPNTSVIELNLAKVGTDSGFRLEGNYIFMGSGRMAQPQTGDLRISYSAVLNNIYVTGFGKLDGDRLTPFMFKGKERLYRAMEGDRETGIATLKSEHTTLAWILRGVGFFMMWFGLSMVFGPIMALAGVLPFLKQLGGFVIKGVTFCIAFVLSIVTILTSMILHNIVALIGTVLLVIAAVVYYFKWRQKKIPTPSALV